MTITREYFLTAVAGAAWLVGCASAPPRPDAELARAQTLIDQAEQQGAQQYAPAELSQARDKLQTATRAADQGKTDVAGRLAAQASADAQLAVARAATGKARAAETEVKQGVQTLREEASRNATGP